MAAPIKPLPVVQNWDCHVTGTCCKEYRVTVTEEERARIEAQDWSSEELGGLPAFVRAGPPWARRWVLNHRADGSCVFLGEGGRCRIHEKHGYETKPLPCRLFPFVLIPVAGEWRVGLRFACPSAAASKGRALPEHHDDLRRFAAALAEREKLEPQPDGALVRPPELAPGTRLDWPDTLRIADALLAMVRDRRSPVERRIRKCLTFVSQLRQVKFADVRGGRLTELLGVLASTADAETAPTPLTVPPPSAIGRMLFRQAAALYTRKDYGPNRGLAARGRLALLGAAWRFSRGTGPVPRMHARLPEATFEELEQPRGPLPAAAEEVLERYYTVKVGSLQFCGAASFGLPFWEGFEALAMTLPIILWAARMGRDRPAEEAVTLALTVVDDHVGFNRLLASFRQRLSFHILARRDEIRRLIAWYSR